MPKVYDFYRSASNSTSFTGIDTRPCYGYFPIKYFSEYEYEATLTR